jgi:cystathionine beta-lyase
MGQRSGHAESDGTRRLSHVPDGAGRATRIAAAGRKAEWTGSAVNPPVWRTSTHLYENSADLAKGRPNADGHFYYGRRGTPTQWALAEALTDLEPGAAGTVLYPSGVAAIAGALLTVLRSGDVLLLADNAYEPSRAMARNLLAPLGIETRFFDPADLAAFPAVFCERTRAVLLENPGSLTMELCDIPALAAVARAKGAVSLLDNTWASPLGFPALQHGCDIAIMSLTKHVGGHSDLMMGSASAAPELYEALRLKAQAMGTVVSPDDAALALRGLRTLDLRLRQSTASALAIAKWLSTRPEVSRVLCPMLPGSPGHDLWLRDFTGGCGLFSLQLHSTDSAARARFIDALTLFGIGFSWGGFESLVIPAEPARIRTATTWNADEGLLIRLSIGLEDPADLISDLTHGFAALADG